MLIDQPQITEGSEIVNATVPAGTSTPADPTLGELFFNTAQGTLQVYTGSSWLDTGNSSAVQTQISNLTSTVNSNATAASTALNLHASDAALHLSTFQNTLLDGLSTSLTPTEVNYLVGTTGAIQTQFNSLSNIYLPKTGGMINGPLVVTGVLTANGGVTGLPLNPSMASDATSKSYVDSLLAGVIWKPSTRVATTGNIPLSGLQTVDGVVLEVGDRVLVKNQTNATQNGIWIATSAAWSRAVDVDEGPELNNAAVYVLEGTVQHDTGWVQTATNIVLDTTPITWAQFAGGGTGPIMGDQGITVTGRNISVNAGLGLMFSGNALVVQPSPRIVTTSGSVDLAQIGANTVVGGSASLTQISYDVYGRVTSSQSFPINTTNIIEGASNLFFTDTRARNSISVSGLGLSYTNGVIALSSQSANGANTIVARDGTGSFAANAIVATTFTGTAATLSGSAVTTQATLASQAAAVGLKGDKAVVVVTTTTQQATVDTRYVLTATSGTTTLTLPASPSVGQSLVVYNQTGRTDVVIGRNGNKIQSLDEDMIVDSAASFELTFINSTFGWLIL